jgi:hypothetical protein
MLILHNSATEKRDACASRFSFENKEGILDHTFYDLIVPITPVPITYYLESVAILEKDYIIVYTKCRKAPRNPAKAGFRLFTSEKFVIFFSLDQVYLPVFHTFFY